MTDDEVDAAFDAISGFEDDGWSADTCAEFQQEPNLAEQCGSWTLGQCDHGAGGIDAAPDRQRL